MKILLDDNILLDLLIRTRPDHSVAQKITSLFLSYGGSNCYPAQSVTTFYYISTNILKGKNFEKKLLFEIENILKDNRQSEKMRVEGAVKLIEAAKKTVAKAQNDSLDIIKKQLLKRNNKKIVLIENVRVLTLIDSAKYCDQQQNLKTPVHYDFEDATNYFIAEREGIDMILTKDRKYPKLKIPIIHVNAVRNAGHYKIEDVIKMIKDHCDKNGKSIENFLERFDNIFSQVYRAQIGSLYEELYPTEDDNIKNTKKS